jgi:hypothetical protein
MIKWQYYPKSDFPSNMIIQVIDVFEKNKDRINSNNHELNSDKVLEIIRLDLIGLGFEVESGKKNDEKIYVPVLFGQNGNCEKSFNADAYNKESRIVIEVEAGRAFTNYQFLKDLFQSCMMKDVEYSIIAVRQKYKKQKDFNKIISFFDTLYASNRMKLPLKGVLLIGY